MTDKPYVLDASAVLAAFFDEPGAGLVAERMAGALFSAVNLTEVIAKLVDRGLPADRILDIMAQLDVEVVPLDAAQAAVAGLLRAETRAAGLSLGDRACLALAVSRGGIAVTANRAWADLAIGAEVEVVR